MASFLQFVSLSVFIFRTRCQDAALDSFDKAVTNGYYNAPGAQQGQEDGICIQRIGDPMSFEECAQACIDHIEAADDNECGGFEVYTRNDVNHCYIFLKSIPDLESECIFYQNDFCQKYDLIPTPDPTSDPTPNPTTCFNDMGSWRIDYLGQSSQFRFYDFCDDNQFVKVKMDSLIEKDTNGKATENRINSFAAQDYYWENEENTEYEGLDAVKNQYISILKTKNGNVDFVLETIVFFESGIVNDDSNVFANTLKWNVDISNWPFLNDDNTLELCINLMTNGGNANINDFELRSPDQAIYDGETQNNVEINEDQEKGNDNHRYFCYSFNSFSNTLDYDPFIDFIDNKPMNESNNNYQVMIGGIILTLILVLSMAIFIWFRKRNKNLKENIKLIDNDKKNIVPKTATYTNN